MADKPILEDCNVNYRIRDGNFIVLTRVATPNFVQGNLPGDTSAYVDVDVFTPEGFLSDSESAVREWVEEAHNREKRAFFGLLPPNVLTNLVEKS